MLQTCPHENELVAFTTRQCDPERLELIAAHLDVCLPCADAVAGAAELLSATDNGDLEAPDATNASDGDRVGRYVVDEELGRGAMGVIYAAYDPLLDRPVALKLLFARQGDSPQSMQRRLQREARALAHLSHPNVVSIFDTGVSDGTAYIAMELVDGTNLRAWRCATRDPSLDDFWRVYLQAGRGLAAAHAAGIVHRDFKPANVLVDKQGNARVSDFGLARLALASSSSPIVGYDLTRGTTSEAWETDDTVAGTPGYMAPEQLRGRACDAKADQFSYCATLYEALCGERPFPGRTAAERYEQMLLGAVLPRSPLRKVSPRVWRVVLRGLRFDPNERFGSMDELLHALELAIRPPRRRRIFTAAVLMTLLPLAAFGAAGQATPICRPDTRWLEEAWGPQRRAHIERAFNATGAPYAARAWLSTKMAIDVWIERWVQASAESCTSVHLDLQRLCLQRRGDELRELSATLSRTDAETLHKVRSLVGDLTPVSVCNDVEALRAVVPLPDSPKLRERVEQIRTVLLRANQMLELGRYSEVLALVDPTVGEAEALGYDPLHAEARIVRGRLLLELGRWQEAKADLAEAVARGIAGGDARLTATASAVLATTLSQSGDPGAALEVIETGLAAARRIEPDVLLAGELLTAQGTAYRRLGRFDEARSRLTEVLQLMEDEFGPAHPRTASALVNLANLDSQQGQLERAERRLRRAIDIEEQIFGREHPDVANYLGNLAIVLSLGGHHEQAIGVANEALHATRAALGPDHDQAVRIANNLGVMYTQIGRLEDALAIHEAVYATRRRTNADDSSNHESLNNIGQTLLGLGRLQRAEEVLQEAHILGMRVHGPRHPSVLVTLYNLGEVALRQGQPERARQLLEETLASRRAVLGPEHPNVGTTLLALGRTLDALGEHRAAKARYDEAARILGQADAEGGRSG